MHCHSRGHPFFSERDGCRASQGRSTGQVGFPIGFLCGFCVTLLSCTFIGCHVSCSFVYGQPCLCSSRSLVSPVIAFFPFSFLPLWRECFMFGGPILWLVKSHSVATCSFSPRSTIHGRHRRRHEALWLQTIAKSVFSSVGHSCYQSSCAHFATGSQREP